VGTRPPALGPGSGALGWIPAIQRTRFAAQAKMAAAAEEAELVLHKESGPRVRGGGGRGGPRSRR
jgi:hypothetical protein